MNVQKLNDTVTGHAAEMALQTYKQHRATYDTRDWEIERIYRAIAKGKTVIAAFNAIVGAGLDEKGRPLLAICRADAKECLCDPSNNSVTYGTVVPGAWRKMRHRLTVPWRGLNYSPTHRAVVPRIPPQHRPATAALSNYHILWEAEWNDIPRDPYLLRRIAKDAWVVLAAWDLTDVEISVLRAHRVQ